MPVIDEVRRALNRTGLSGDYTIVVNPADYAALASILVEREYALATYMGARVVQDAAHPTGHVTIVNGGTGATLWPPPSPAAPVADWTWPIVSVPRFIGGSPARPGVQTTVLQVNTEPPPEPTPLTLWERLVDDDE